MKTREMAQELHALVAASVATFERTVRESGASDQETVHRLYEEARRWADNPDIARPLRRRARELWLLMPHENPGWEEEA